MGGKPQDDPGCKAYKDSDCDLKTNETSLSRDTPLLSEFARYGEWWAAEKRWGNMLYNRPVISGVDYFINNIKENKVQ